jgi:hypothetical protein
LAPRAAAKLAEACFTLPWAKILIPFGEIPQQRLPDRIDYSPKSVISGSRLWLRPETAMCDSLSHVSWSSTEAEGILV